MRRPAAVLCLIVGALASCNAAAFATDTTGVASPVSVPTTTSSATTSTTTPSTTTIASTTTSAASPSTTTGHAATHHAAAVPAAAAPGDPVVTIKSGTGACLFCFSPAAVTIPSGGTVTWTNASGADHTVARCTPAACNGESGGTGTDATFSKSTIAVPPGTSFHYTFAQPGTYLYYCTIHGYAVMHGTITVTAAATTTTATASAPGPATSTPPAVETVNPLASTGASAEPLVLMGVVVLLAGIAAVTIGSRRRTHR